MNRPLGIAFALLFALACNPNSIAPKDDTANPEGDTDTDTDSDTDTDTDTDTDVPPTDEDGDGWLSDEDCDDTDPDINPDADEVDDGIDNDCDEWVDELEVCDDGVAPYQVIQEAIDAAAEGGVVQLCPGTWHENLLIRGKVLTLASMEGPDVTTVDGGGFTPLTVTQVSGAGASVQGITFQGGVSTTYGGGVSCSQATLELVDNVITGCEAPTGGGLVASACALTMYANEIADNSATSNGGGAYLYNCSGELVGNLFEGNSANNGGGLLIQGDGMLVAENVFRANEVVYGENETAFGGGLYLYGSGDITDNEFVENHSEDDGGAAYIYGGYGEFADNTVEYNTCGNDGAGVYFSVSHFTVSNNTFSDNAAADDAGGLRIYVGYQEIRDNYLYRNTANDDGGGLKASHSHSNNFTGNYFEGNVAGDAGGGFELDNETSPVDDCTFVDNEAYRGAGLHSWRNEQANYLTNLVFQGNAATDCGGGLAIDNDQYRITVRNSSFFENTADDGAAICSDEFWWDSNDDGKAESMYRSNITLQNLAIWDNESWDDGALYFRVSDVAISNVAITDHVGPGVSGIAVKGESVVTMTNSIIADTSGGPALYAEDSTITVSYSDLYDNSGGNASGLDDPTGANGNIAEDPDFADPGAGDLTLDAGSPCIDAGNPAAAQNDADGSRNDMGAYGGPYGAW